MIRSLERCTALAALPAAASALFADPARELGASRLWFEQSIAHALPAGALPALLADAGPAALWPMLLSGAERLSSLTTPYTTLFAPLFAPAADAAAHRAAGEAFGRFCRRWAVVRLDALDAEAPPLPAWTLGIRRAGLRILRFDHFGNWHEPLAGRDFAAYLADRPGALRETLRRKLRRAEAGGGFALVRSADGLADAIAAYEDVYARSWKPAEPFPLFNPALIEATAAAGILRLGILRLGGRPVAVQFWVVCGGVATVLKLAHDEAARALSPGTVLTAWMIRALLEQDAITAVDFGRGDDPYKRHWARARRQRIGLMLINPRRPAGLAALARGLASAARARLRGR